MSSQPLDFLGVVESRRGRGSKQSRRGTTKDASIKEKRPGLGSNTLRIHTDIYMYTCLCMELIWNNKGTRTRRCICLSIWACMCMFVFTHRLVRLLIDQPVSRPSLLVSIHDDCHACFPGHQDLRFAAAARHHRRHRP